MRTDFYARLVAICCRRATPWLSPAIRLLACICTSEFQMNGSSEVFFAGIDWRQRLSGLAAFPQRIISAAVIDGARPNARPRPRRPSRRLWLRAGPVPGGARPGGGRFLHP
jgi:hypothetical protein